MRRRILLLLPVVFVVACVGTKDASAKTDATPPAQAKADHGADEATLRRIYQSMPTDVTVPDVGVF